MTQQSTDTLRRLLVAQGLASCVEGLYPDDQILQAMLELLDRVSVEYELRTGNRLSFAPRELELAAQRNPHKIQAFLQAMVISNSPETLVMVWRILEGLVIRELTIDYRQRRGFVLNVALSPAGDFGEPLEVYQSTDINDVALLAHLGIVTIRGEPLFEGFYPIGVENEHEATAAT